MLLDIIKEHNMSQAQLAQEMGVSRQAVHNWAHGLRVPQVKYMHSIAQVLDVPVEKICVACILGTGRTP